MRAFHKLSDGLPFYAFAISGFDTRTKKRIETMEGKLDCYRSRDGVHWIQTNFQEGGGTSGITQYSSQEWAKTTVNSVVQYLGMWGMAMVAYNSTDGTQVSIVYAYLRLVVA